MDGTTIATLVGNVGVAGAIAVYMVWWVTRKLNSKIDRLNASIEKLTDTINTLIDKIED